jgi:hypothetical protein
MRRKFLLDDLGESAKVWTVSEADICRVIRIIQRSLSTVRGSSIRHQRNQFIVSLLARLYNVERQVIDRKSDYSPFTSRSS